MYVKKLKEKRAVLQKKLQEIMGKADTENRAMNEEEVRAFEDTEKEIKNLDASIAVAERAHNLGLKPEKEEDRAVDDGKDSDQKQKDVAEERAFANYIRGEVEERADVTLSKGENGAIIPVSIGNRIISKVKEICPIYAEAEHYHVKGKLSIPYYDETAQRITMTYAEEGKGGDSTSGKFTNIDLTGFLGRAITDISKSLIHNSDFNVTEYVIAKMAEAISVFLEHEILVGTSGKITGLSTAKQVVTAASATAITSDEIIDLQEMIPDRYQEGAYFIMAKSTRTEVRKLKDGQKNYLLNKDANSRWGYTLFGHDVYVSDNMPAMAAGKTAIYYVNPKGLAVNVTEDINIQVLREVKATQHMDEVVGFVEADAKIQDEQMVAVLKMKTA